MPEATSTEAAVDRRKLFSKISWRLIPYIFLLYILAYLDRVNVGFAALEMRRDLMLSATVYGTGAGIFFLGQGLFDLPSNLLLGKVGPRLWIARIMITWGIIATCMSLVKGAHSFYLVRFLLGVSEAGFFPGMILYLTYWFPSEERARAVAKFMTATSLAGVIGAPISSFLLKLEGKAGMHGWQWLFIVEGIPTILGGISVLFLLRDHPRDAPWLTDAEKQWLDDELEQDRKAGGASEHHNLRDAFKMPMVWVLAGIFLLDQIGIYTVNFWMPLVLNSIVHPAPQPRKELSNGAADGRSFALHASLPRGRHCHRHRRLVERSPAGAPLAHDRLHAGQCRRLRLGRPGPLPGHRPDRLHPCRDRLLQPDGTLLGAADPRPWWTGCSRRRRHHHHGRQPRQLRRPGHHRPPARCDPQLLGRPLRRRRCRRLAAILCLLLPGRKPEEKRA